MKSLWEFKHFIHENAFKLVVRQNSAILHRPQYSNVKREKFPLRRHVCARLIMPNEILIWEKYTYPIETNFSPLQWVNVITFFKLNFSEHRKTGNLRYLTHTKIWGFTSRNGFRNDQNDKIWHVIYACMFQISIKVFITYTVIPQSYLNDKGWHV